MAVKNANNVFLTISLLGFISVSEVNSLTCFKNPKFDPKAPGDNVENCGDNKVCVRLLETKGNATLRDEIGCGTIEDCNNNGKQNKGNDTSLDFFCYECNTDKCIPVANTSDGEVLSTTSSISTNGNHVTSMNGTTRNGTTTIGTTTIFDDEDDQDDPDEILYRKEAVREAKARAPGGFVCDYEVKLFVTMVFIILVPVSFHTY